jgi:hypothetical protein
VALFPLVAVRLQPRAVEAEEASPPTPT